MLWRSSKCKTVAISLSGHFIKNNRVKICKGEKESHTFTVNTVF